MVCEILKNADVIYINQSWIMYRKAKIFKLHMMIDISVAFIQINKVFEKYCYLKFDLTF